MEFQDLLFEKRNHVATITLNRPEVYNAFRGRTCSELVQALARAGYDKDVGAIVLTGAGEKAFCTGGDQSAHDGQYEGDRGIIGMPIDEVHSAIRDVPKPVIAKVRGYAIGGGNVLATICDLTLAAETAIFGQVGPTWPPGGRQSGIPYAAVCCRFGSTVQMQSKPLHNVLLSIVRGRWQGMSYA